MFQKYNYEILSNNVGNIYSLIGHFCDESYEIGKMLIIRTQLTPKEIGILLKDADVKIKEVGRLGLEFSRLATQ